jgi:hypothetical protein
MNCEKKWITNLSFKLKCEINNYEKCEIEKIKELKYEINNKYDESN